MKIKKTFKESFGSNPWDPWSTKANITEGGMLDKYLLSRGLNPATLSKDVKIAHSKSNQFKQWAANQREEVEIDDNLIEASSGQLHRYLLSRGIDPMRVSKDSKIAHAKSNQFKQWAMSQTEEVQSEDHVAIAMGKQLDDEGSMVLNQLDMIEDAIEELRNVVKDPNMQLPAWVQSKITLAADYMDTVSHYMSSKNEDGMNEEVELEEGSIHDWFKKEKWVRMDTKGNIKGQCAREPGEGKPKCLPQAKAHALGKEGRAKAARRKRREDPNPNRSGKAINVRTEEVTQIDEKKDACYHKVKSRYKVWPSAYASGALVKCRKAGAKNWGNKSEEIEEGSVQDKLHAQHQTLRKKSGLPNPDYYKELGKSYDISDDKERLAKQSEIKKKYSVESVLYDDPKGTLTRVSERRKEMSRSARIIKALYKKKGMKEDTYDWEKDDKSTSSYGKKPKMSMSDDKASKVKKESDAAAVLSGGTTLTKQNRDIVELDPRMKVRSNKDAQDADDDNKSQ